MTQFIAAAEKWLMASTSIPVRQRLALAGAIPGLLQSLPLSRPCVIAVSGPPGTGKSTIAHACSAALECTGQTSIVLSLDDYYLSSPERGKLSRSEHRLFAVRGVPGTHDFELLVEQLQVLLDPNHGEILLPIFDKYSDRRLKDSRKVAAGYSPEFVFIEGWIAGVPPQPGEQLLLPVNDLESSQDSDGEWRHRVNAQLYDYFSALDPLVDIRWHFQAPGWESVIEWRWLQEQASQQKMLKSRNEVANFLDYFQRLCKHMHNSCDQWADIIIQLDANHMPSIASTT